MGGEERLGFLQAVLCFYRAAAFADDNNQRLRQTAADLGKNPVHAVRVGIINKVKVQLILQVEERLSHKNRPQTAAADTDNQGVSERLTARRTNLGGVDAAHKSSNIRLRLFNLSGDLRIGGQIGVTQPIMPHHPPLIGVGNSTSLQRLHIGQRLIQQRLMARKIQRCFGA